RGVQGSREVGGSGAGAAKARGPRARPLTPGPSDTEQVPDGQVAPGAGISALLLEPAFFCDTRLSKKNAGCSGPLGGAVLSRVRCAEAASPTRSVSPGRVSPTAASGRHHWPRCTWPDSDGARGRRVRRD